MCSGGGSGGAPVYIPAAQPVQAAASVDADKSASDIADDSKKKKAAQASSNENISTSSLGLVNQPKVQNKTLLGQ